MDNYESTQKPPSCGTIISLLIWVTICGFLFRDPISNYFNKSRADYLLTNGLSYMQSKDIEKALQKFNEAQEVYKKIGGEKGRLGKAQCTGNIGTVHLISGDYQTAIEYYFQAKDIYESWEGEKSIEAWLLGPNIYTNIGLVFNKLGDYEQALQYQGKALNEVQNLKSSQAYEQQSLSERLSAASYIKSAEYTVFFNNGVLYRNLGDFEVAVNYFQKSIDLIETEVESDRNLRERAWAQIGIIYLEKGDWESAYSYIQDSDDSFAFGELFLVSKEYSKAVDTFNGSLKKAEETKDIELAFASHVGLGLSYEALGDFLKAHEHYQKAIDITQATLDLLPTDWAQGFMTAKTYGIERSEPYEGIQRVSNK